MLTLSRGLNPYSRHVANENLDGLLRPHDRTGYCNGRDGWRYRQSWGPKLFLSPPMLGPGHCAAGWTNDAVIGDGALCCSSLRIYECLSPDT